MPRGCQIVRVFTMDGTGGNRLGVVNDTSGLDDDTMQLIATELGFSETIFADWREAHRPPRVRIFTTLTELPFAGHPLVGAAWVYTHLGPGGPGRLECPAGTVGYRTEGDVTWVDAMVPVTVDELRPDPAAVAAFGVGKPVRTWTVRLPLPYLLAEMGADHDVTAAAPSGLGDTELYLFHREGATVHARFFAPSLGPTEDPATGSAAVALAHALMTEGEEESDLVVHQGEEIGSPSAILLRWDRQRVAIGGTVVRDESRFLDR